jgi:hypothetical protein
VSGKNGAPWSSAAVCHVCSIRGERDDRSSNVNSSAERGTQWSASYSSNVAKGVTVTREQREAVNTMFLTQHLA